MKKSRFSESQIVAILKQADGGLEVKEVCRQAGISTATYYQWKSKYGGLEASELKRVKEMEAVLSQYKRMTTSHSAPRASRAVPELGRRAACCIADRTPSMQAGSA